MTTSVLEQPTIQPANCDIVPATYGLPLDKALIDAFPGDAETIAENLIQAKYVPHDPYRQVNSTGQIMGGVTGEVEALRDRAIRSDMVLKELGCTACVYNVECPVKEILDTNIELADRTEAARQDLEMLATAPDWLRILRNKLNTLDIATSAGQQAVFAKLESALSPRSTSLEVDGTTSDQRHSNELHKLLEGIENRPIPDKPTDTFEELSIISDSLLRKGDKPVVLEGTQIRFEDRDCMFEIYDASEVIDFGGEKIPKDDLPVILEKFYERLHEPDSNNKPQITSNHGSKMQKSLRFPCLNELRMGGSKNRLYFTLQELPIVQADGTKPVSYSGRIVILGGHGGNDDTQTEFLRHIGIN
jgi:hypothetical protein